MNTLKLALVFALLGHASMARAEGSEELGLGQRLVDDTVLDVDIERAGEGIFLRAASDVADAVDVEVTAPSGLVHRGSLTAGRGWTTSLGDNVCAGYPFVTREVGTYQVRFVVRAESLEPWLRTLTPFDVAVTSSACDEAILKGRLHATRWHLRANDWSRDSAFTTSFFVLASPDIVALDLEGVAGFEYFIQAGPRGLEAPYERTSQLARVAPPPTSRAVYPLYLHPPPLRSEASDALGRLDGFIQAREGAALALTFHESCRWEITIDRDRDGVLDVVRDAPVLRGSAEAGSTDVFAPTSGLVAAAGGRIRLQTQEVHFAAYDVETARPGISFSRWNPLAGRREPLAIYWDDRFLVLGEARENPLPVEALDGLAGVRHAWGSYAASSPGNDAWVDTWASARTQTIAFELQDPTLVPEDARLDPDAAVRAPDASLSVADGGVSFSDANVVPTPRGGLSGGAVCSARPRARSNPLVLLVALALLTVLRRRPA